MWMHDVVIYLVAEWYLNIVTNPPVQYSPFAPKATLRPGTQSPYVSLMPTGEFCK